MKGENNERKLGALNLQKIKTRTYNFTDGVLLTAVLGGV